MNEDMTDTSPRFCSLSEVEVFLTNTSFFAQGIVNSVLGKQDAIHRLLDNRLIE
jgi:hypothetical protein